MFPSLLLLAAIVPGVGSAQAPLPDLVVRIESVKRLARPPTAPASQYPEYVCELVYEVKNVGAAPAQSPQGYLSTSFTLDGEPVLGQGIPHRGALPPQGVAKDTVLLFKDAKTSCAASPTIVVRIDPVNQVRESDENNNAASSAGAVRPTDLGNIHMCTDRHRSMKSVRPRAEERRARLAADGSLEKPQGQALTSLPDSLWETGRTIRVRLATKDSSAALRTRIRGFAMEWTSFANLQLDFVGPSDPAEIRVGFDKGGSWSAIGRQALGIPFDFSTMNFGWFTDSTPDTEVRRVVLHEFGHALGLVHEHQSSTSPIQWDKEKAYAYYKATNGWSPADVDGDVFKRYQASETNYSPYDSLSIMHYHVDPSITLDGKGTTENNVLSAQDKKWIAMWYPRPTDQVGVIRTNDDCDTIEFKVESGVVPADKVLFVLRFGANVTWWKGVAIPTGNNYTVMETQGDNPLQLASIDVANVDKSRKMRFGKAKGLGVHTWLPFEWDALPAISGGMKMTLRWVRDRC
ncbi:Hypothetical protein A7982_10326 [Minicystis rosea]|nr:Hypothetical protein A7982_10326 [Minicystis rosea]